MEQGTPRFEKRYKAFISYSHADNKEQGRKWADWLHHSLETYQIPAELVGQTNQHGQKIPAQIYPVFQDEKELSAKKADPIGQRIAYITGAAELVRVEKIAKPHEERQQARKTQGKGGIER